MSLTISLMPHQSKAINELKSGSILCGGVGTGKSMTALAYYYLVICRGVLWSNCVLGPLLEPRPLYIITTARKRDTGEWEKEMERFGLQKGGENEVPYVIDSWNNLPKYSKEFGAFFILDEQRVIGKGTWVKAFYKIARKNKWIILSATPGDTWADYIPVFVANGFYKNRTEFLQEHAVYNPFITKFPKIDRWTGVGKLERYRREITVLMKYEKKTKRHWETIKFSYDKDKYDTIIKKRWDPWNNEPIKDISSCCYLMRRVCNSSIERAKRVLWITLNSSTQKSIVFYNYNYELSLIKDIIKETLEELRENSQVFGNSAEMEIAEWNGHKHEPIPRSRSWIYLVQYAAGAEGWNCTETDTIIFYSRSYSYKQTEQAAGRIDRLNTEFENLYYYVMTTSSPIDCAVEKALKEKKTFNENKFWTKETLLSGSSEEEKKSRYYYNGYLPEVQLEQYKMGTDYPCQSMEDALNVIKDWKEKYNDIKKAWITVYKDNQIIRKEDIII